MPFTVKSHCVSAHSLRGAGSASRLSFSNDELCQRGWKIEKYGKGFKWITNEGQTFYSSREVQSYLEKELCSSLTIRMLIIDLQLVAMTASAHLKSYIFPRLHTAPQNGE